MNTSFLLNKEGRLVVVIDINHTGRTDLIETISMRDYLEYKNDLINYLQNGKILVTKYNSLEDYVHFRDAESLLSALKKSTMEKSLKLVKDFFESNSKYASIKHEYENKDQLYLTLSKGSFYLDEETKDVVYVEVGFGEYHQGDYGGTTDEGCHYMAYGGIYMKPSDIYEAALLFSVLQYTGYVDLRELNKTIFENKLNFTNVEELSREQKIKEE